MNQRQKSILSKLNIYNWSLGVKLNFLVYILLGLSFTVIAIVAFNFLEKYSEKSTYQRLEQLTYHKKQLLEKEYSNFLNASKKLFNEDLIYSIEGLRNAYKDYSYERGESFSPDSINRSIVLLKDYYETELIADIEWKKPILEDIFPERDIEIVLQRTYLVENKWPKGEKDKLIDPKTGTGYDSYHQTIHAEFRKFKRSHTINNIYLIDPNTGDIIYNYNKNITLGTNLFNGAFRTSELSRIFQEALSSTLKDDKLFFSDYTNFLPESNKPVAYIAKTLTLYNDKVAVAVIELGSAYFESIIVDDWLELNSDNIELNLVGEEGLFRMNEIEQQTDAQQYFNNLKSKGIRNGNLMKAFQLKGGAYVLRFGDARIQTSTGLSLLNNDYNEELFALNIGLNLEGFNWSIVGYSKLDNNQKLFVQAKWRLLLVYILLLGLVTFALRRAVKSIIDRLAKLSNSFVNLSKGYSVEDINSLYNDEISETMKVFNTINKRVRSTEELAIQLSQGKLNNKFEAASEEDTLANALNVLGESLKEDRTKTELREKEDEITKWLNEGIAEFNNLLRKSNNNIKELAFIVIENLVGYLEANQGGVFLVEGNSDASQCINLIAAFAYDSRKYNEKTIEIGEGLLGNCYLEKKSIHLTNIPEGYIEITSGLGGALPRSLYIVPLMMDEKVLGFIEIASFNKFEDHHVDFIEKLSINIAATFSTVKLNTRTAELLEESKRRSNEIAQQEEEMRQNMEEMQATQEELARLREEDERRTNELQEQIESTSSMLQTVVNSISGEVIVKDSHGVVVLANEEACNRYKMTVEEIKGTVDSDILDKTILEDEHTLDKNIVKEGKYFGYRTESVDGHLVEYSIEKRTFFLQGKKQDGVITIWKKVDKGEE